MRKRCSRPRFIYYLLFVATMIVLFCFGELSVVVAHGELINAEPAPGAIVETAPEQLRLTFSEPNSAESRVDLYSTAFHQIDGVHTTVNPELPEQLIVTVPSLAKGRYIVQWIVRSLDGHELRGSYTFVTLNEMKPRQSVKWWRILLIPTLFGLFLLMHKATIRSLLRWTLSGMSRYMK